MFFVFFPSFSEKSVYLLEASRMCLVQQQPDIARKIIRQAGDLCQDQGPEAPSTVQRKEQMMLMLSNTYDQGYVSALSLESASMDA